MQVRRCLLFLIVGFVGSQAVFDIDKAVITVRLVGTEITITVPENPDVTSVFFSTELGDECSAGFSYMQNAHLNNSMGYRHNLKHKLSDNHLLKVVGVFETQNQVITKSYDYKIDANGNGVKQKQAETCDHFEQITQKPPRKIIPTRSEEECIQAEWKSNVEDKRICSGNLMFEETFNDNTLHNWTHEVFSRLHSEHGEPVAFLKNDTYSYVKDGQLHLTATLTEPMRRGHKYILANCTSRNKPIKHCGPYKTNLKQPAPPFNSALLRTKESLRFKYGRYEIRAKMPIGDWLMPYLILQPYDFGLDDNPQQHIRLAYVRGNQKLQDTSHTDMGGRVLFGSAFIQSENGQLREEKRNMPHKMGVHFGEEFHNYTMIWHKDRIIFKVDGIPYDAIKDQHVLNKLNKSKHYYLAFGLTVGGKYNFPDNEIQYDSAKQFKVNDIKAPFKFREQFSNISKTWTHPKLVIEHVRVFATDPQEQ